MLLPSSEDFLRINKQETELKTALSSLSNWKAGVKVTCNKRRFQKGYNSKRQHEIKF